LVPEGRLELPTPRL